MQEPDTVMAIATMELPKAYRAYKALINHDEGREETEAEEELELVTYGIKENFDLDDVIEDRATIKSKDEIALVGGKTIPLKEYRKELRAREKLIKAELLRLYMAEEQLFKPRENGE